VAGNEAAELLDGEPGDGEVRVDGGVAEGFAEVALAGAGWAGDDEVLVAGDPFQRRECSLGGGRDREPGGVEAVEGFAGGERGFAAADLDGGCVSAGGFSSSRARTISVGSQRWALAVATTSATWRRM
jgi:hypothetical protein